MANQFCGVIRQIIGTDAAHVVETSPSSASGVGAEGAIDQLGQDIRTATSYAATDQLRQELAHYQKSVEAAGRTEGVLSALPLRPSGAESTHA
jgi:hypothetical protein